jgi:YVTN family beta-propeller protein
MAIWGSNNVSVINGTTNRVITNIGVGYHPEGLVYDSANGYIYVTNFYSGSVSIISTSYTTNPLPSSNNYLIYIIIALVMIAAAIGVAMAMRRNNLFYYLYYFFIFTFN